MGRPAPDIINALRREILSLQGYRPAVAATGKQLLPAAVCKVFPQGIFPLGALHECLVQNRMQEAATGGFLAALLAGILAEQGIGIWISQRPAIYPPALANFSLYPEHIIFIRVKNEKEACWATEEVLHCNGIGAVVAELPKLDFTFSRRLQLAAEKSRVTGFIIRPENAMTANSTSAARWQVRSLPSETADDLPGVGYPRWQVELVKVKNGKGGSWQLEWDATKIKLITAATVITRERQRQTG